MTLSKHFGGEAKIPLANVTFILGFTKVEKRTTRQKFVLAPPDLWVSLHELWLRCVEWKLLELWN